MAHVDSFTLAFTNLQPDDIFDALDELGFVCNGRILALNSYENRVYKLGQEDGEDIVVKFYRPGRWSDDAIVEEHQFAAELEAQDIPVIAPIIIDGESLFTSGPFRLAIYPCRGGRAPDLDNYELQRQLGRFVARIHSVGETSDFRHPLTTCWPKTSSLAKCTTSTKVLPISLSAVSRIVTSARIQFARFDCTAISTRATCLSPAMRCI